MNNRNKDNRIPSWTSPKGGSRGCLCDDGTYSSKCCDGSLQAQGIGNITGVRAIEIPYYLLLETEEYLIQENNDKIIL